jgi:sec-independent protein translocase protein TatB
MSEMLFFGVLALLILGPRRGSELGREVGKFVGELRRLSNGFKEGIQGEMAQFTTQTEQLLNESTRHADLREVVCVPVQESLAVFANLDSATDREAVLPAAEIVYQLGDGVEKVHG